MTTILLSVLLATEAFAQDEETSPAEAEVQAEEVPAARDLEQALQAAKELERAGEPGAARALASWVAAQPDVGATKAAADGLVRRLPDGPSLTQQKVRLIAFETALGAWLLGGNPVYNEAYGDSEIPYLAGALVGGGLGTVGAVAFMRLPGFDAAGYDALVGSQQLGATNLALLATIVQWSADTDADLAPAGLAVGAVGGTGLGYWWASHDPHPVAPVAMRSGAVWGLGLALVGMSATYSWDDISEEGLLLSLLAGVDVGAGVGLALPHVLPVTREQVRFANLGGLVGAASAYAFVYTTSDLIWYMPHDVALVVGGAGLAGGALGVVLATRLEHAPELPVADAMFRTEDGRLRVAVPVPRPMVVPGVEPQLGLGVSLVHQAF